ncbi:retrotransposable element Tf2 [Tanacetum coccineum]
MAHRSGVNVKQLRGFLGLTGYYRRFIKNYAIISKPLTTLLKKYSFTWNPDAQVAFESLKTAMSQAPVLALPDFNSHTSGDWCFSLALSTYEKEFYAVLMALEKWRGYLLDRHFKIKTDHFSLKYLLDQRLTTPFQAKWLPKLMGYDYEISYKKGSENTIKNSWEGDVDLQLLITQMTDHTYTGTKYTWTNGELRKGKLVVGNDEQLIHVIGHRTFHTDQIGGPNQKKRSQIWQPSPGYLQPLPIPTKVWHDISMDFIEALPPSQGKTVLFVVVDRLSKYAHFIPMSRYLLDRHFTIKTDHFSLKYLLDHRLTTPFQAKWLPKLMGYDYEISYKKGSENTVADALSRIYNGSELCSLILSSMTNHTYTGTKYTWTNGELRKGKLVVGNDEQLRKALVTYFHSDPIGGHSGVQVTGVQVTRNKSDLAASPSYLQPLPIPTKVWHDISMDFIEALPPSQGKTVLFVVVDRLSKYAHFIPMSHPFTAKQVAQALMDNVYKLHDGQTEVVNKCGMFHEVYDGSAHTTPFEIVYGQPPNLHVPYIGGTSAIEEVDRTMQAREQAIAMLQFHLKRSQDRIKSMADKKRSDRSFEVGMKVYLKLQPYRQITARQGIHHKFAAKFYGPFLIIAKVGKVAYKLDLPADSQIHPVFHVSQLKLCKGTNHQVGVLPHCGPDGVLSMEPEAIIGRRLGKLNNKAVLYVLVKWINQTEEDATWELYTDLIKRFPQMELHP